MTQLRAAREGELSAALKEVARQEGIEAERLRELVAAGSVVLPANPGHSGLQPRGIGRELRVKVNANLGTSPAQTDLQAELEKLQVALEAGADTVMDLSTGGDLAAIRAAILERCPLPLGTVPIYEAVALTMERGGSSPADLDPELLFEVIERQAQQGIDFMTVHCGVTARGLQLLQDGRRLAGVVSRGGAFLAVWMLHHHRENLLYERFDELLAIARCHDVTLSLGDGLRPGCLADAGDAAQIEELVTLGALVERCRQADVQVMVEGPGHVPLDQIRAQVELEKTVCRGAPFYVLGPLVTDIAPGYDHISGAIGGALAAWAGADFLCYVTPAEHLGLPSAADVRAGVIAARIAAHAADIARGRPAARDPDDAMARARLALDWDQQTQLALDPPLVCASRQAWQEEHGEGEEADLCSMCGRFCAVRTAREAFPRRTSRDVRSGKGTSLP
jgi:phosphomethylpyrimidine synthase